MPKHEPSWAHSTVLYQDRFFEMESFLRDPSIMQVRVCLDGKWSQPETTTLQPGMDLMRRAEETARLIIDRARL